MADADEPRRGADGDVVVPMELYKVVTVFSTLIAVFCVVFGFILLDAATLDASLLRRAFTDLLAAVGLRADEGALEIAFALAGILLIGAGAGTYVLGTRFRTEGMGNHKDDAD
ncbi:DUF7315 family membrane protein [Halomarina litorea]|uniref:DUF7315 family membrane protein n=1 Tax=Halomarina litorea TaxID=2961595 RepID=UPI0020C1EE1B|nr:hypothetical protein [Halomarina sp. BCD28]